MKRLVTGCTCVVAVFALLAAGCDEPENTLTAADRDLIATAGSGIGVTEQLVTLAADAIVADGTGGSIKSVRGKAEAPTGAISFRSGTFNLPVDLNPIQNWSGTLDVEVTGSVSGDETAGSVTYSVTITRVTDVTCANPITVDPKWTLATAPAGPGLQFVLDISWTATDVNNCLITISFDAARSGANALPLTIETPDGTISAVLDEEIHNALTLGASAGELVGSISTSGHREVTWTVDTETHAVRIDVDWGIAVSGQNEVTVRDSVTVTVDGVVFGPYTLIELGLALIFAQ